MFWKIKICITCLSATYIEDNKIIDTTFVVRFYINIKKKNKATEA